MSNLDMEKLPFDSGFFGTLLANEGMSPETLASVIGVESEQVQRLTSGQPTTDRAFLDRLIPVFGLTETAILILDPDLRFPYLVGLSDELITK